MISVGFDVGAGFDFIGLRGWGGVEWEHHTVGGLGAQTQEPDKRLSDEVRRSGIRDTHWDIAKCETADCDGLGDYASLDDTAAVSDDKGLVQGVGFTALGEVVRASVAGVDCRKGRIEDPARGQC